MSKGLRPRKNNPYIVQVREAGQMDAGSMESTKVCWDFQLIEPSVLAKTVENGESVQGSIEQQKHLILIRAGGNPLGYAPFNTSQEIVETLKQVGGRLSGFITSKDIGNFNIWIRLCVN